MNKTSPIEDNRIKKHFITPWLEVKNRNLINIKYSDISSCDLYEEKNKSIHIIAQEVELKFDNNKSLFISWNSEVNWEQYVLSLSNRTFINDHSNTYTMSKDEHWKNFIDHKCKTITVWGYKEYRVTETSYAPIQNVKKKVYLNQPHMLRINFGKDQDVFFGNFYMEDDFEPKYPIGDDLWIIFNAQVAENLIHKFEFDTLI